MTISDAQEVYLQDCSVRLRSSTVDRYAFALKQKPNNATELKVWKSFYAWCVRREIFDKNPYAHEQVSFAERDRLLTDDEIAAIWGYNHRPYSDLIKLLILTGQRRGQMHRFREEWIEGDTILFPRDVMKSKRPHVIPASTQVDLSRFRAAPLKAIIAAKEKDYGAETDG